jgi:DNA-binding transcriptional LysR family regulator
MQSIRLYIDVAARRSFSQAAARHGISQSAASQCVGRLERRLGVTLIDRSVRPLVLTEAGEEFLRGCRALVRRYERLEAHVARRREPSAGIVRVDAIYSAGIDLLNQIRDQFLAENPRINVVVVYKRPEEVYDAVRQQTCDLGILSYPQRWREVAVIPLRHERMALVCTPGHALAGRLMVQARELGPYPLIGFDPGLPVSRHTRRYLRQQGVQPVVTHVFDNVDTIKSAVAVTQQAAILPRRTVAREVAAGSLVAIELRPVLRRPMGIIHAKGRGGGKGALTAAAQEFVDYLIRHVGPDSAQSPPERQAAVHTPAPQEQLVGEKP